ncbi:MAG: ribosome-associated translation inhibitor RaiA [Dehalococcoidales bacterium]|nr:ribosome-associated translation inhibitor RaiA [Dehalococcoidales bacterium]
MDLKITGKNVEVTPELNQYIEKKLGKLNRHLAKKLEAKLEITKVKTRSPGQRFIAQVTVNSSGTLLRAEERGKDLLTTIDKVAAIMERQIERFKGKHYTKKGRTSPRKTGIEAVTKPEHQVVKFKQFEVRMMPADEAVEQMELLSHDFFLFLNNETGRLNLLYRRKDKDYGLIEPKLD